VHRLLEGEELPHFDISEAFKARQTTFSPRRSSTWSPPLTQIQDAQGIRPEDAKSYGGRVGPQLEGRASVDQVQARKRTGLIKANTLAKQPRSASAATLGRVQQIIADSFDVPADQVDPGLSLAMLLPMEGDRNIGARVVADALLGLEDAFGVELITVMVGTWVRSKIPASVTTVGQLADLLEGGEASSDSGPAAAAEAPQPPAVTTCHRVR